MSEPDCSQQAYAAEQYDHDFRKLEDDYEQLRAEFEQYKAWAEPQIVTHGQDALLIERLRGLLRDIDAIGVEFGPKIQSRIDAELAADRDGAAT